MKFVNQLLERAVEVAKIEDKKARMHAIYTWSMEPNAEVTYDQITQKVWTIRTGRCSFGKRKTYTRKQPSTVISDTHLYQLENVLIDSKNRTIRGICNKNNLDISIVGDNFVIRY
jgi:hypothetical protein